MVALSHIDGETVEFSRRVLADFAGIDGSRIDFKATAEERAALARRFDLESLERLRGDATLTLVDEGRVRAEVTFEADVIQLCVVTLEPVATAISETFSVDFAATDATEDAGEIVFEMSDEDPPEDVVDGHFDLGEAVAQHLATLIDPYPRAADVEVEVSEAGRDEDPAPKRAHPFAALERLRARE